MKIKIAPSILSADFSRLGDEIKRVQSAGADLIHIDVMDGHFVPNITIGATVVRCIRKVTRLPLESHLMIENPVKYIDDFIACGSDMISLHIETVSKNEFRVQSSRLKAKGIKLGISLNPDTALSKIKGVLDLADFVLIMSVHPGFGGQEFIPKVLPKIRQLRARFNKDIAVDGGVNDKTAKRIIAAGANILVAGSYIFRSKDARRAIKGLRNAK